MKKWASKVIKLGVFVGGFSPSPYFFCLFDPILLHNVRTSLYSSLDAQATDFSFQLPICNNRGKLGKCFDRTLVIIVFEVVKIIINYRVRIVRIHVSKKLAKSQPLSDTRAYLMTSLR